MFLRLYSYLTRSDFEKAAEKLLKLSEWAGKKNFTVLRGGLAEMSIEFTKEAMKETLNESIRRINQPNNRAIKR